MSSYISNISLLVVGIIFIKISKINFYVMNIVIKMLNLIIFSPWL